MRLLALTWPPEPNPMQDVLVRLFDVKKASRPKPVLFDPVVLDAKAEEPKAVFPALMCLK